MIKRNAYIYLYTLIFSTMKMETGAVCIRILMWCNVCVCLYIWEKNLFVVIYVHFYIYVYNENFFMYIRVHIFSDAFEKFKKKFHPIESPFISLDGVRWRRQDKMCFAWALRLLFFIIYSFWGTRMWELQGIVEHIIRFWDWLVDYQKKLLTIYWSFFQRTYQHFSEYNMFKNHGTIYNQQREYRIDSWIEMI